jgi:hypothetical protein
VYKLNEEEWTIAEQLSDILKVCCQHQMLCGMFYRLAAFQILKDATEFFSRSTPNLATVIPATDYIGDRLAATNADNQALSLAIKASLRLGEKTLDRYYSFTRHVLSPWVLVSFFSSCLF